MFFVDTNQRVAFFDLGSPEAMEQQAKNTGAHIEIKKLALLSRFCCAGSDGYLAWLGNTLGIRDTANVKLGQDSYDLTVFDSPSTMYDEILKLNEGGDSAYSQGIAGLGRVRRILCTMILSLRNMIFKCVGMILTLVRVGSCTLKV